ncbi:MAG: PAQR family membrane homeostasis protein TrhA [Acidimicrobiales bacterium]
MYALAPQPEVHVKPKFRGVSHQIAFFVFVALGIGLISFAPGGRARVAVTIYSVCMAGMFGVSAAFHRHSWSPPARRRMRRLDHSMIFAAVAGTYTPIAVLALHGVTRAVILWLAWLGAAAGVVLKLLWLDAPKWVIAVVYVALGWAAIGVVPELTHTAGVGAILLLLIGGLLYTIGAVVYALRRPDPRPTVFGYHEVFHALVIMAALCHWALVAFFVMELPA